MLAMLQIVIGIVFVLLLFSLLASSLMELIAGWLSLRGRHLLKAIRAMLGDLMMTRFLQHPYFEQLALGSRERAAAAGSPVKAFPSYIETAAFSAILLDLIELDTDAEIQAKLDEQPEGPFKDMLVFLYRQSGEDYLAFRRKVEEWYGAVMDRASGAYKRHSQRWLLIIGLAVAVVFNADTINIYHSLSINSTLREAVAAAAENYINNNPTPPAPVNLDNPDVEQARQKIGQLVNENIAAFESPLGLGWDTLDWTQMDGKTWLYKIMGWLVTAVGISFGAAFWFELLKKLINIRNTGPAPAPTPTQPAPVGFVPIVPSGGGALTTQPGDMLEGFKRDAKPPAKKKSAKPDRPPAGK
jgi:hypothetical protein